MKTNDVAIFIPTYNRPHTLERLTYNIIEVTPDPFRIYFIVEAMDEWTIKEVERLGQLYIVNQGGPTYADCINTAYRKTVENFFFTGADDLKFYPGWKEEALACMGKGIAVVGTNDYGHIPVGSGRNSTHYMVKRSYIDQESGCVDAQKVVLHPYSHNYTDVEFTETAQMRGVYMYCEKSIVEHMHWAWGKAQMDATYRKGFETSKQDEQLFMQRRHLWQNV